MEVDPVCSVQFSNHTGYPTVRGDVFDGAQLRALGEGLASNGLLDHTHLLTGYIGSASLLQEIADLCGRLRAHSPELTYVCDPVLGDEGRLYVAPELVEAYRATLLPLASVITPNQFEAELLISAPAGSLSSLEAACEAAEALHEAGPHTVVITSLALAGREGRARPGEEGAAAAGGGGEGGEGEEGAEYLTLLASTRLPQRGGGHTGGARRLVVRIRRIRAYFTGTGDLFSALLLAWLHRHPGDLATAVEKAVGGLQAVLADTAARCGPAALAAERTAEVCSARELRLIPNQDLLREPPRSHRCEVAEP